MQKKRQNALPRLLDSARLAAVLCSAACFLVPAVFAKLPLPGVRALHAAGYILWGVLAAEAAVCLARMEKEARRYFLKLHKSDLVFCAAILLVIVFIFPFFNVVAVSLSAPDQIVNLFPKQIDLYSMKYVLTDSGFFRSMGVSIVVTAVGTALSVISMAMAAYPLSKARMPLRRSMMMFFVIVMLFTGGMAPNMLLMNALHLNNTIWSLIFPSVVQVFYLILLKGFFEDVPEELEESARLDGASNYTILFRIVLPVAAPMVATVAFFTMISYWNNINNAILYITSNQSIYPLPMYIRNFLNRNPMEVAMTNPTLVRYWDNVKMSYVLFSIVPVMLVYPFTFKYLKNGVAMGAVKG